MASDGVSHTFSPERLKQPRCRLKPRVALLVDFVGIQDCFRDYRETSVWLHHFTLVDGGPELAFAALVLLMPTEIYTGSMNPIQCAIESGFRK